MKSTDVKDLFANYDIAKALKNDEPHDIISEIADNQVDIYTSDLLKWVGEAENYSFVEDAIEEMGFPEDSQGKPDFIQAIRQGQYKEAEEALWIAWEELKEENK